MKQVLCSSLRPDERALGAKVGSILSPHIKPKSFRDYGGLRKFIDDNLSSVLIWINRTNAYPGDDIYQLVSGTTEKTDYWQDIAVQQGGDFWRYYSNPRIPATFALSDSLDRLCFASGPRVTLPPAFLPFPKQTTDRYRQYAREFSISLPSDQQAEASKILSLEDFNAKWVGFLRSEFASGVIQEWEEVRVRKVFQGFSDDLKRLQVSEAFVRTALKNLEWSRNATLKERRSAAPKSGEEHSANAIRRSLARDAGHYSSLAEETLDELRLIAHSAVDKMDCDELRSLRLPLGVVIDVFHSK